MRSSYYLCVTLFLLSTCEAVLSAQPRPKEESQEGETDGRGEIWAPVEPLERRGSSLQASVFRRRGWNAAAISATSVLEGASTLSRSGESVRVTWRGVPNVKARDWIGLFIQGTEDDAALEKYLAGIAGAGWLHGAGTLQVPLLNVRKPLVFRYMRQETSAGGFERVAESEPLTFAHLEDEPLQIHIELADNLPDVKVKFVTNQRDGVAQVRYGTDPTHLQLVATETESTTYRAEDMCGYPANSSQSGYFIDPGFFHTVELVGLLPRTRYFYQVGVRKNGESFGVDDTVWSDVIDFISPHGPSHEGKVSFITFGDHGTVDGGPWTSEVLTRDLVKDFEDEDARPAFLLHIGDIAYARGRGYLWDKWGAQIQPYASRYPYMVSIGNHEYDHTSGAEKDPSGAGLGFHPSWGNYKDDSHGECGVPPFYRYSAPSTGFAIWWYSLNYGPVHIIQLSTEHDYTAGSRQYQWLQQDLSRVDRARTPWVVLTGHRPMYNSENAAGNWKTSLGIQRALEDLLTGYGVDLAVWGHYHSYERTCRVYKGQCVSDTSRGLVHVTVGMAGNTLAYGQYKDVPWRVAANQGSYGYSITEVDRENLLFRVVTDDGGKIDEFSFHKGTSRQ